MTTDNIIKILNKIKDKVPVKNIVTLINRAMKIYIFIDPETGMIIKSAQFVGDLLLDIESEINNENNEETIRLKLNEFEDRISKIEKEIIKIKQDVVNVKQDIEILKPKITLIHKVDKWEFDNTKGISSVSDISNSQFRINFIENLHEYDKYCIYCNIGGAICEIDEFGINVELPKNYVHSKIPLTLCTQKMI
nr:hypothetical protein [Pseudodesulfovibrio sp.]